MLERMTDWLNDLFVLGFFKHTDNKQLKNNNWPIIDQKGAGWSLSLLSCIQILPEKRSKKYILNKDKGNQNQN